MKGKILFLIFVVSLVFSAQNVKAQDEATKNFSLFYEYYKNKDFESALPYGWKVINTDPKPWLRFKVFPKMEDILWYMHDSSKVAESDQKAFNDTMIYFYNKAIEYHPEQAGYYIARKAYVEDTWMHKDPQDIVPLYEEALTKDPQLDDFYKDQLGAIYIKYKEDNPDYKLKAIELYQNLANAEPDNPRWNQILEGIVDNVDELIDILKKAWDLDKDNVDKAWKYASTCIKAQEFEKAVEPLEFLVAKTPDVINYWKQLGYVYDKLDQNDNSIKAYKKLIELQPDSKDNYLNLALVYKRMDQLSISRTYLQKAMKADASWDYPYIVEAQLYEQAASKCDFDFMAKCVYLLAVNTYRKAASMGGQYASAASDRIKTLANSIPTKEDFFFRNLKSGDTIKIEGQCYAWIDRSVNVP